MNIWCAGPWGEAWRFCLAIFIYFTKEIESFDFVHPRIGWKYLFQYLYYIYLNLLCGKNNYFHHILWPFIYFTHFSYKKIIKNIYFQKKSRPLPSILMVAPLSLWENNDWEKNIPAWSRHHCLIEWKRVRTSWVVKVCVYCLTYVLSVRMVLVFRVRVIVHRTRKEVSEFQPDNPGEIWCSGEASCYEGERGL